MKYHTYKRITVTFKQKVIRVISVAFMPLDQVNELWAEAVKMKRGEVQVEIA